MIIFDEDQILSEIFASNTLRDKGVNLNIAISENGANIQKQRTIIDEAVDVVKATPGAVGDFGVGVAKGVPVGASKFGTEIMDTITDGAYSKSFIPFVNEKLPIIGDINNYINNLLKPEGTAQEVGSAIGEGVGQVVLPGAVGTKALQGVNIGSTFLRNVLGYGSAEAIGMNPQDQGLLELGTSFFVSNDNLKQEIINSLKANEDQSVLMQKIQKAPQRFFEGGIVGEALGKAIEGVGVLYRAMKGSDKIKNALQNIGEKAQGELDLEKNTTDLPEKVDLSKRKTVKTLGSLPAVAVANNPVVGALSKIGDTSVAKTVTPNTFSNFIKNLYAGIVPDKNTAEMIQDNISNIQNNMADDGLIDSPDYEDLQVAYDDLAQIVKDNKFPTKIELHTSANDLYKNNVIENIESNYKGDEEFLENMYDIKLDPEPNVKTVGEIDKGSNKTLAKFAPNNIMDDTKLVLRKRAEEMKLPTNKRTMPSGKNPLFDTSDEAYQKLEVEQKETPVPRKTEDQVYPLNNRAKAIEDKADAIADALAKKIIPFKGRNIQYFYNTSPIIKKAVELGIPRETAIEQLMKFGKNYASTSPRTMTDQNLRNASLVATKENIGVDLNKILGPGGDGVNEKGYPMMINPGGIHKKLIDASRAEGISFDTNPKPATFAENVAGNLEGVTVDTHAIRAVIDVMNELEPGSVPIEWIGGKTAKKTKQFQKMYKNDPSSLDVSTMVRDTLETQALNKISKQTEYAVFSDIYKKVAEKAGVKPAEAQSLSWFANGEKTGLASEPKTIVELIDDRIDVTSQLTGMTKEEVFKKFMQGSIPLASAGGLTLLDTGAMIQEGDDDGST